MQLPRSRSGFTMVELSISSSILTLCFGVGFALFVGGSQLFTGTLSALKGPDAAEILLARFETDLLQSLQALGDPRPPVQITETGIRFYRVSEAHSSRDRLVGRPSSWEFLRSRKTGRIHPVRDGEVLEELELSYFRFQLIEPVSAEEDEQHLESWWLGYEFHFPVSGARRRDYEIRGVLRLSQPSTQFKYGPISSYLAEGPPLVQMLPSPRGEDVPWRVGPTWPSQELKEAQE